MSNPSLVKKLRIQPGQRIPILNPPAGYQDQKVWSALRFRPVEQVGR